TRAVVEFDRSCRTLSKGDLLHLSLSPPLQLLGRHGLDAGCDIPYMTERVGDTTAPVTVEFVFERHQLPGAGSDCPVEDRVRVFHIRVDMDRRAASGDRGLPIRVFWILVRYHKRRIADPDLGMPDLAVGVGDPL